MKKVTNKLRVYHLAQIPCEPFYVEVKDEFEAIKIINTLADQHLFLFENKIIPDFVNYLGIQMFDKEENKWVDYWNEYEDMDFDELKETYLL